MARIARPARRTCFAFCAPLPCHSTWLPNMRPLVSASPMSFRRRCGALQSSTLSPVLTLSARARSVARDVGVIGSSHVAASGATAQGNVISGGAAPGRVLSALSTLVGVLVLIGSVLYKVPQVVRIIRRRSARGISVLMYGLETLGHTFSAVYFARRAFPFSTYGETVFIMIQNVAILGLIVRYEDLPRAPAIVIGILFAACLVFLASPIAPLRLLIGLQVASIPLLNLAKIPQIALNFRRKDTGELSSTTLGLQLLGNVARIFTTVAQVRDPLMLIGTLVATVFNSTLFLQWIYYSRTIRAKAVTLKGGSRT